MMISMTIDFSNASESIRLDLTFVNSDFVHFIAIGRGWQSNDTRFKIVDSSR